MDPVPLGIIDRFVSPASLSCHSNQFTSYTNSLIIIIRCYPALLVVRSIVFLEWHEGLKGRAIRTRKNSDMSKGIRSMHRPSVFLDERKSYDMKSNFLVSCKSFYIHKLAIWDITQFLRHLMV